MARRKYAIPALFVAMVALVSVSWSYWERYRQREAEREARETARETAVVNYYRIVRAQYEYHQEHDHFPAGIATDKRIGLSWRVAILPYLGEWELYRLFVLDEPWDSPLNKALIGKMPAVFASPGKPAPPGYTFVRSTQGPGGMLPVPGGPLPDDAKPGALVRGRSIGRFNTVTDGTSNTALFLEGGEAVPWTKPDEITVPFGSADPRLMPFKLPKFGGVFDDGFHIARVDGSVAFLRHDYPERYLAALLTPNGGETFAKYEEKELKPGMWVGCKAPPGPPLPELWKPW